MKFIDVVECWYFNTEEEADEHDLKKAVGYSKVVNTTLKEFWGDITTDWHYVLSKTITEE